MVAEQPLAPTLLPIQAVQQPVVTAQLPLAADLIVVEAFGDQALCAGHCHLGGALAAVVEAPVQLALAVEDDDVDVPVTQEQAQHLLVDGLFVITLLGLEVAMQLLHHGAGLLAFQVALELFGRFVQGVFRGC